MQISKRVILVTGGTGFIGSKLIKILVDNSFSVVLLKRSTSDMRNISHYLDRIIQHEIDVSGLESLFRNNKIDVIIHLACNYGKKNDSNIEIVKTNILFGIELLKLAKKYSIKAFINTGTVLHRSINSYALSKWQFEEWLNLYKNDFRVVNVKFDYVYGSGDDQTKFLPWLVQQLFCNVEMIKMTDGNQKRDFVHVSDVVSAFLLILKKLNSLDEFEQIEIGTGNQTPLKFVTDLAYMKVNNKLENELSTVIKYGSVPNRANEDLLYNINNARIMSLGWIPEMDINKGLMELVENFNLDQNHV